MSTKAKETKQIRAQVPDAERCLFTSTHGRRCSNPHVGTTTGYCILHEGRMEKVDAAEVQAVAEQLLAKNVDLATREDVNRITSQLYTMVAEKRISRQDGSLLAYIASVLLQTIVPVKRKSLRDQDMEFLASSAAGPRDDRFTLNRDSAARIPEDRTELNRKIAARFAPQEQMPGRSYNPYTYPTKLK